MCRLAGIIDRSNPSLRQDILAMRDAMHRGGPDDEGMYLDVDKGIALGHRRLSIIDLSAAGHQPMQRDGIILTFNGEIYNYKELRQQLTASGHSFTTDSDTEVIIRAYQQWGGACFDRFRGMFALAILDSAKGELILARDHAGIKPLYVHCDGSRLYFASEVRSFNALGSRFSEREDWKVFFLTYGFLPEPVTTLKDVHPIPKGSYRVFNIHTLASSEVTYFGENYSEHITDLAVAKDLIRASLTTSVERHLVADAPIGLFLSGGIDSSLLTLLAQPYKPDDLHTLSLVFDDVAFSEHQYQQLIIDKTGARHQSFRLSKADFEDSFDDILHAMDQPSTDGINSYFICKYARKAGLKAVISGLGADELFGGYPSFRLSGKYPSLKKLPDLLLALAQLAPKDSHRKFAFLRQRDAIGEYLFYRGYFTRSETARLLDMDQRQVARSLDSVTVPAFVQALPAGNRVSYLESNLYMQSQLLKDTDSMSMWHSLEVRVPFLDYDLMKAVNSISNDLKFSQAQAKHLLIESFKDLLPREIWDRKKQGFVLPFSKWMKGAGLLAGGNTNEPRERLLNARFNKGRLAWSRYWAYLLSKIPLAPVPADAAGISHTSAPQAPAKPLKVLFLSLTTFSHAGGIEKFNRCFLKALGQLEEDGLLTSFACSPYDDEPDERYCGKDRFRGYKGRRLLFALSVVKMARNFDHIIVGHLNLAPIASLIRVLYPQKKITLITHGIEVWEPLQGLKHKLLQKVDSILAVSNFTKDKLIAIQGIAAEKIKIFPNTIDPYFPVPGQFSDDGSLRKIYNIKSADPVLFTLSRLSSREKYKGYDIVIECLPELKKAFPSIRYIIAGKYDAAEKTRLDSIIALHGLETNVIITGYLEESQLVNYYQSSDLFIMPSKKEGFGIVFLEALVCGVPVIAGNQDGSVDALRNGELGTLVNPSDKDEIIAGISAALDARHTYSDLHRKEMQAKTIGYFGFQTYVSRIRSVLGLPASLNRGKGTHARVVRPAETELR